jgi:RNA polymerase sigma-70 factor (ECF subfamily)
MSSESSDFPFEQLIAQLKKGDAEAAEAIFKRFARRLIGLARAHLEGVARNKEDPEDVVQSAFASFFSATKEWDLLSWDSLWSLLTVITVRKCGHRIEKLYAQCRDVRREKAKPATEDDSYMDWVAVAREPTADEALQLGETVEKTVLELDERDQSIFLLSLQGLSVQQIREQMQCTERTVYRSLERIKLLLTRRCQE